MNLKTRFFLKSIVMCLLLNGCAGSVNSKKEIEPVNEEIVMKQSKEEVLSIINKVNTNWQENHPQSGNAFWHVASYHTGNMEAYKITNNKKYLDYSMAWAEKNKWMGAKSQNKSEWKYSYGETDKYVLFGDWQICFQTYIDLYTITGKTDAKKIERALEVMEYQMNTPKSDYWWWADGLYMVMPVMTKLYNLTGNELYLEKLDEYLAYADSIMYDDASKNLFYH